MKNIVNNYVCFIKFLKYSDGDLVNSIQMLNVNL